jgi:hypothetical protein
MSTALMALLATALLAAGADDAAFVTSDPNGGWSTGGYYVHNNLWNSAKYRPCSSTLSAKSHADWSVATRMNNRTGDGAVKTYPNVHKDFRRVPIDQFESLTSRFAATSPHVGIYNVAFDLWLNGIASPGCTEIMIWTENYKQVPGGKFVQDVDFGGRRYKVYRDPRTRYLAFVAAADFTSGTIDLLEIMKWTIARGWLPADSTLHQVCFGVEFVSTDDAEATFRVTDFAIEAKSKARRD